MKNNTEKQSGMCHRLLITHVKPGVKTERASRCTFCHRRALDLLSRFINAYMERNYDLLSKSESGAVFTSKSSKEKVVLALTSEPIEVNTQTQTAVSA